MESHESLDKSEINKDELTVSRVLRTLFDFSVQDEEVQLRSPLEKIPLSCYQIGRVDNERRAAFK